MNVGVHVKYSLLLSDFDKTRIFSADFRRKSGVDGGVGVGVNGGGGVGVIDVDVGSVGADCDVGVGVRVVPQ
jgi:hypothetical protein